MDYIIVTLFGVFVGISTAGYMFTTKINKQERKIANQNAMIKNRDISIDDQCTKLSQIKLILKEQQYNSVENLTNKIKTVLFPSDQTSK